MKTRAGRLLERFTRLREMEDMGGEGNMGGDMKPHEPEDVGADFSDLEDADTDEAEYGYSQDIEPGTEEYYQDDENGDDWI